MAETTALLKKLNTVKASRFLKQKQAIEDHMVFPQTLAEEQDQVRKVLFAYLKTRFRGCAIRPNTLSFSIRLDGQIHEKANRIRNLMNNDQEWRRWFEQNHRDLYRDVRNGNSFNDGQFEFRQTDGRWFLYIPHTIPRIRDYGTTGLNFVLYHLEKQYVKETEVADYYDRANALMQAEIVRRDEERRQRLEAKRSDYFTRIQNNVLKPLDRSVDRTSNTVEAKLANKMIQWCRENGKETVYFAQEPTYQNIVAVGTDIRILRRVGSREQDWLAVPMFDGFEMPEGYEEPQVGSYGTVTGHDETSARSRNGEAPIQVMDYMYMGFNLDSWRHVLPADYWQILDVTRQFRVEAETEYAAEQEVERQHLRAEAERLAELVEADKIKKIHEAEARAALTAQLRAQVAQAPQEPQPQAEMRGASEPGLYKDSFGYGIGTYVAINQDTIVRRFGHPGDAARWLDSCDGKFPTEVKNFYNPSNVTLVYDEDEGQWIES